MTINDAASGKSGRHANFAMRRRHEQMDPDDSPMVELLGHMGSEGEKMIRIDFEQFGGPITDDELRALYDVLDARFGDDD